MADEIRYQRHAVIQDTRERWCVYHRDDVGFIDPPMAICDSKESADTLLALLRFQSAMTPEMWAHVKDGAELVALQMVDDPEDALIVALDTLREELQQP